LGREQRIAAQFKEIIMDAHIAHIQNLAPDLSQHFFGRIARRYVGGGQLEMARPAVPLNMERTTVQLAVFGAR
jgi:hypothetical protein